jgi:DNA-binding transcriptional LysR family regulator
MTHRSNSFNGYVTSFIAMDLRQLHALLAVAEHQSFSAAARALHTVQSNVSTHVAHLENELGSVLIERSRGQLTPEGEIVAARARRILGELRSIEDDLVSLREDVSGHVRLGVIGTTAVWLVPALLDALARDYPRVEITIVEATTTSLVPQLLSERIDVAIANLPVSDPDIDCRTLFEEDRVLIAPDDHPLATRDRVSWRDLSQHEILLPPVGTGFRDEIDADARRARVSLNAKAKVDGLRLMTSLATRGFAPAIVPASAVPVSSGPWCRVSIDASSRRIVGLALPRRVTPSASTRVVVDEIVTVVTAETPAITGISAATTTISPGEE